MSAPAVRAAPPRLTTRQRGELIAEREAVIKLTPKQANIYAWGFQPEARFRYAVCGRRFGKTFLTTKEIRRAARLAIKLNVDTDNEIWYGAPTLKQAKRVFWRRIKKAIPPSWRAGKPSETDCAITLLSGHIIRVVGLDNYDDLRGSGLFFFVGDEWADCKIEAWEEVIQPMLSTCKGHALFIGTPKGFDHFYEGFVDGQPGGKRAKNTKSWQYTTVQGGNVDEEEIAQAKATKDPRVYRQEYEASFENYSGRVYYSFTRIGSVRPCPYDADLPVHIGMDFNVNPMSASVWQEHGEQSWQIAEIVIPTSNTSEMAAEIKRRYVRPNTPEEPGREAADMERVTIYPDSSGAQNKTSAQGETDLSILRKAGFKVNVRRANPQVRDRQNVVNARFEAADGTRRAFIDPSCTVSIKCFEQLVFKEGTSDQDKTLGLDHLPDASGYYMHTRFERKPATVTAFNI